MGVPQGHDPTHDRDIAGLRVYVKAMAELGVDSIKFLMSSDEGFAPGGAQLLMYSRRKPRPLVRRQGRPGSGSPATPRRPRR